MVDEFTKIAPTMQLLMIVYKMSETVRDNFGKFIYQFQTETNTLIRKLERILIEL